LTILVDLLIIELLCKEEIIAGLLENCVRWWVHFILVYEGADV